MAVRVGVSCTLRVAAVKNGQVQSPDTASFSVQQPDGSIIGPYVGIVESDGEHFSCAWTPGYSGWHLLLCDTSGTNAAHHGVLKFWVEP